MKLTNLLTGAAIAALVSGAASAQNFALANTDGAATNAIEAAIIIPSELNFTALNPGRFEAAVTPSAVGQFPSGTSTITVDLTNATFGTAVALADMIEATNNVAGTCFSGAALASGGAVAQSSVVFTADISGCAAATLTDDILAFDLPIRPSSTGTVSAAISITQTSPAYSFTDSLTIATNNTAFTTAVTADTTLTQIDLSSTPKFPAFDPVGADAILGTVAVAPRANTFKVIPGTTGNLGGVAVAAADMTALKVTVSGDYTGQNAPTLNGVAASAAGNSFAAGAAEFNSATSSAFNGNFVLVDNTTANPQVELNASAYSVAIEGTLAAATYATTAVAGSGNLQSSVREGTTVALPWTSSNGTNSVIRLVNESATAVPFTGRVLRTDSGAAATSSISLGTIPANSEIVVYSASGPAGAVVLSDAALFGDFGRGDVEMFFEAAAGNLIAQRFLVTGTGEVTDFPIFSAGDTTTGVATVEGTLPR